MKKRILTLLLSVLMLGTYIAPHALGEEEKYSNAERICIGLGCIDENEYVPDKNVTRAEFAKIISGLYGLNTDNSQSEWDKNVYGNDNDTKMQIINPQNDIFDDVDSSHPYCNDIIAVYDLGFMTGISQRRFAPEYDITVLEVVKVFTDMAGYSKMAQLQGGYPSGYESIAYQIGLLNRINKGSREIVTQQDVLNIIYNALNVKIVEFSMASGQEASYSKSGKTFMEGILKTYKIRGAILDNGITSVYSESKIRDNEIKVGDLTAVLPDELASFKKFIGRTVEAYYTFDEDIDEYLIKYMYVSDSDNSITFDIDDFVSYKDGKITYNVGKRTVTKNISKGADLIYNNKFKSEYVLESGSGKKSVFDFESGNVTLCSTTGNSYDIIIVNNYEYVWVMGINLNDDTIYNGIKGKSSVEEALNLNSLNMLTLNDTSFPDFIFISDENGKTLTISDIEAGDVLNVLRCDGGIDIVVSRKQITDFAVKNVRKNEIGRTVLSNGENEYELLGIYEDSDDAKNISLNQRYNIYLTFDNKIIWLDETIKTGYQMGILSRVFYDEEYGDEPLKMLKIYTQNNKIETFYSEEKIKVNDKRGDFDKMINSLENALGNAILFEVTEDNKVKSVITPVEFGHDQDNTETKSRGWYKITPSGVKYRYGINGYDFNQFFYYVPGQTKTFEAPMDSENFRNENYYSYGKLRLQDNREYENLEAYSTSADAIEADMILKRVESENVSSDTGDVDTYSAFIIESISTGLNSDDEPVTVMNGYSVGVYKGGVEYTTIMLDPEAIMVHNGYDTTESDLRWKKIAPNESEDKYGPRTVSELEPGDIIRYGTNVKGMVNYITIAYDRSHKNAFFTEHNSRTYTGDIVSKDKAGIRISDAIKPEHIKNATVEEITENLKAFRINSKPIIIVDGNKKLNFRIGSEEEIVAYKDSGVAGEYDRAAVITYVTGAVYATVIYKK